MKKIIIGLYRHDNPIKAQRKERTISLNKQARLQNIELIYFGDNDINLKNKTIKGKVWEDNEWVVKTRPIPKCTINIIPPLKKNRTKTEKELRKLTKFTTYLIGNKKYINNRIEEEGKYSHLLVPTNEIVAIDDVFNLITKYNEIILKPASGRQGKGIYYIRKEREEKYVLLEGTQKHILTQKDLNDFYLDKINNKNYLGQKYLRCLTKSKEPFDFRIHIQRDGLGEWSVTKIYPRIGDSRGVLSNISRGGRTINIDDFLKSEWKDKYKDIKNELINTSIGLCKHIDSFYNFTIDELGIDLAIDDNFNIWFYEANTGPQSKYHEDARAIKVLSYAKYLHMVENTLDNKGIRLGEQVFKKENKAVVDYNLIGMFSDVRYGGVLKETCSDVAKYNGYKFMYFTRKGIDFESNKIEGYYYSRRELKKGIFDIPSVVIDRHKMLGSKGSKKHYEFLTKNGAILNGTLKGGVGNKLRIYKELNENNILKKYIIPTKNINDISFNEFLCYVEDNKTIFLKPNKGSLGIGSQQLISLSSNSFLLKNNDGEKELDLKELKLLFKSLKNKNYIIQKYIKSRNIYNRNSDIRVHLLKNIRGNWEIAHIYSRVGAENSVASNLSQGGYLEPVEKNLKDKFQEGYNDILTRIKVLSFNVANFVEDNYQDKVPHIALDIGVEDSGEIWIFEVNINKPMPVHCEKEIARYLVEYAIFLNRK